MTTVLPLQQRRWFQVASIKAGSPLMVIGLGKCICYFGFQASIQDPIDNYMMISSSQQTWINYNKSNTPTTIYTKIMSIKVLLYCGFLLQTIQCFDQVISREFWTNLFTDEDIIGTVPGYEWVVLGSNIPSIRYFSECNGKRIFGGFDILSGSLTGAPASIQKTYNNLSPHYQIRIQMKLYKIDSWNNEELFVVLDGTTVKTYKWDQNTGTEDICGNQDPVFTSYDPQYNDQQIQFDETIVHTTDTLSIQIISNLYGFSGAWGINDLQITLKRCHGSCGACYNPGSCSSCSPGMNLAGLYCTCTPGKKIAIKQENCFSTVCATCQNPSCPLYYYDNGQECSRCHLACSQCTGPQNISPECAVCEVGYLPGTSGNACEKCFGVCTECSGFAFNQCLACQYGYFLINNQCQTSCPDGFYPSQSLHQCLACSSPCVNCEGSTNGYCLSCQVGNYLYQSTCDTTCPSNMFSFNQICIDSCPFTTYSDANRICQPCPSSDCLTCNENGECILCKNGTFLSSYDYICYKECPSNYYGDEIDRVCVSCDSLCLTCSGPSSSECQSCHVGTFLVENSCYSECPPHTYSDNCHLCHQECLDCIGPDLNQCTSCDTDKYWHMNFSTCLSSCGSGEIANSQDMTCIKCEQGKFSLYSQCQECNPSCLSCTDSLFCDCSQCISYDTEQSMSIVYQYSLCVYKDTKQIYIPQLMKSDPVILKIIRFTIYLNLLIALLLQIIFRYKTNLLMFIELMQLLSYYYYLCSQLSLSTQRILLFIYNFNISAILTLNGLVPDIQYEQPSDREIFSKGVLMQKTGIFYLDSLYVHGMIVVLVIIYAMARGCKGWLYRKINPYLLSYGFRLLFLEYVFCLFIFLFSIDFEKQQTVGSLVLLAVDILVLGASFFWKIRTDTQRSVSHYALFYFNELGAVNGYSELSKNQITQNKSILPSMLYYFGKIPFVFIIVFFYKNPVVQSISLLVFTVFMAGINLAIEYRRRIIRMLSHFMNISLVIASILMVASAFSLDISLIFDYFILSVVAILLLITLMQIITNYIFFISVWYFCKQKVKACCKGEQQ